MTATSEVRSFQISKAFTGKKLLVSKNNRRTNVHVTGNLRTIGDLVSESSWQRKQIVLWFQRGFQLLDSGLSDTRSK
ncbi:hypothetical protein J6590_045177 [Homalodisca vitripennis]|nr:hypothetical protein J6590_045177 [Homalodisca vitripennis]